VPVSPCSSTETPLGERAVERPQRGGAGAELGVAAIGRGVALDRRGAKHEERVAELEHGAVADHRAPGHGAIDDRAVLRVRVIEHPP
jgi:hypothetical protein